ncbi:GTPase [Saccharibacter floricola]|uniref:G domain-containing protein n=1 Tax=Saccharibacter floricola DSM 15669 TaxID=1123227 RepID=A0ABQ0NYY4_9PROT|nr:GTPase domain-containing protein [Saccharibacter floricola]GBQ06956.1 hypothetical protein AA15669_1166 [Saccharibacter floricola DSM 15669]
MANHKAQTFCAAAEACFHTVSFQEWGHDLHEYPGSVGQGVRFLDETRDTLKTTLNTTMNAQEWDKLVIAFYGETNAGKSTLIEALCSHFDKNGQQTRKHQPIGAAIGDGRSDYTRTTTAYPCSLGGQAFTLLDVPGIEGREDIVQEEIKRAVSSAHVIFYVTSDAAPPQTSGGDTTRDGHHNEIEGTLEKIKHHLREEARIYRIFNKRTQSPRMLANGLTVTDEERATLIDADHHIKSVLGRTYEGHITLSALPAFLAINAPFPAEHRFFSQQKKFLAALPAEKLLDASGLQHFLHLLEHDILPQSHQRIIDTNLSKLFRIVQTTEHTVTHTADGILAPLDETYALLEDAAWAYSQLPFDIQHDYNRLATRLEEIFINDVRQRMDIHHKDAMWSDFDGTVREKLEAAIKESLKELSRFGEGEVEHFVERSYKRMRRIDQRFVSIMQQNTLTTLEDFCPQTDKLTEELVFKTASGIDGWGLGGTIAGVLIGLCLGPIGWVEAAIAGVGGLWSMRKLLDSSYQEQQQKDAIEAVLNNIRPKLSKALHENLSAISTPLCSFCCKKEKEFQTIATHVNETKQELTHTRDELTSFCKKNTSLSLNT